MLRQLENCDHVSVTLIQLRILKVPILSKNGLANSKVKKQNVLSLSSPNTKCTQQEFDPKAKFRDNFYEEQAVLLVLRQQTVEVADHDLEVHPRVQSMNSLLQEDNKLFQILTKSNEEKFTNDKLTFKDTFYGLLSGVMI